MILLSKKLVEKVLNIKLHHTDVKDNNLILFIINNKYKDNNNIKVINIYEFAFKIKEWAVKMGYIISSEIQMYGSIAQLNSEDYTLEPLNFKADTEIEAIIKAGEWILEQL